MNARTALQKFIARESLVREEARTLFDAIMDGRVETPLLAGLLAALAMKGETVEELVGAAEAMRKRVTPVRVPVGVSAIDTCGTGGDGKPTFNVSSAVAIVAAAAGATVAKHGNRSHVRPSGSAEGLAALGIATEADVPTLERCLAECRVAFLFAVRLHPAMQHAAAARTALGVRTIFNLLGPLTNPAGVRRQLMGVPRPESVALIADVLQRLGAERALVVHGLDGLCDLSLSGPTRLARIDSGAIIFEEISCKVAGLTPAPLEAICVGGPDESAAMIERVLAGGGGAPRDMVILNAAAALWVAGIAADWTDGAARAADAIDSGAARETLVRWRSLSRG